MQNKKARKMLLEAGFTATAMGYFCSKCGLEAEKQPKEKLHPMKPEVDRLKAIRDVNPRGSRLWKAYNAKYHETQRLMYNRSICSNTTICAGKIASKSLRIASAASRSTEYGIYVTVMARDTRTAQMISLYAAICSEAATTKLNGCCGHLPSKTKHAGRKT